MKQPIVGTVERRAARDKALLLSIFTGFGIRILGLVAGLATLAITARSLDVTAFGMVATLAALVGVAGYADFGLGLGLMSRVAQAVGAGDEDSLRTLVASALAPLTGVGILVASIGTTSILWFPWKLVLGSPSVSAWDLNVSVVVFAISVGLAIPASIGHRILLGLQRGAIANLWSFAASIGQFGAVLCSWWLGAPVWAFVAAAIFVPALASFIESTWVLISQPALRPGIQHLSRAAVADILRVGAMFFSLNLAIAVSYQSDTLIVSTALGATSAAVFAVAMRMFGAISGLFAISLQQFWPALTEALSRGDLDWSRLRFSQILFSSTALLAGINCLLIIFGQQVTQVWVGDALAPSFGLLMAFAAWTVYAHAMSQFSTLLNAGGIVMPQVWMAFAMALVNVPLSFYLAQRVGIVGPLLGSLVAHVLCAAAPTLFYTSKLLRRGIETKASRG